MTIKKKISSLFFAGAMTFATQTYASDDFFVYVSPDPIGVNAFLEMGKIGIEAAAAKYNADVQTYESTSAVARRENVEAALNEGASLIVVLGFEFNDCLLYTSPSPRDATLSRMPSSA